MYKTYTISLDEMDLEKIRKYCKSKDVKISTLFRRGAKMLMEAEK